MRHSQRNMLAGLAIALASLMGFVLLPSPVTAQSFYGSITGTVTDPTGGVLPGASVTATNIGTNAKAHAVTGADGSYRFVNLVPADYQMDVELSGFKHMTRGPIPVRVQATVHVDFKLEVGEITETVEVTAEAKLLQTESGELSSVVSGETVQEMPLNGRNVMNLIALAPGVVPQGSTEGPTTMNQGTHTNNAGWGNFQIGGSIAGQSAWYIDGGTINVLNSNTIALVPTQDAIQEFRVSSNATSSEFGRSGGGVVNMTTKSGTNSFHGSAYGYMRNKSLNANDFFSELNNKPKADWSQYQYGGTLSGPLMKNKLFFFGAYEHFKSRLNSPTTANVPSEEMRAGIFHRKITDPTGRGCVTQPAANTWQINPSCFDPTSVIMRDEVYYAPPNASDPAYNFFSTPQIGNDGDQFNARLDYNVSDNHRIFARYTYWKAADLPFDTYDNILTANASSKNIAQQAVIGDTYSFNPTTVLDVRLSYLREYYDDLQPSEGLDLSMFGPAWGALNGQVTFQTTPGFSFSGPNNLAGGKGQLTSLRYFNVYGFATSLTKILANHTLKFGGEIRLSDANMTGTSTTHSGSLTYNTLLVGDEYAAFLMGLPTQLQIGKLYPTSTFNWYQGYYVADTWAVNKKLTLNLGLRWELPGTTAEKWDRATVLLPDGIDPATNHRGTLALVKSDLWSSRNMMKTRYNLFAPRLGLAYQLNDRTVFRAGYGLNYLPAEVMEGGMFALSSPINAAQSVWVNRVDPKTGLLVGPYRTTSSPFPDGPPEPTGRSDPNFMLKLQNQNFPGYNPDQDYPHAQQWNVSLGHEFAGELMVELSYAGSKGSNLPLPGGNNNINMNLNELESQYWALGDALLATSPADPTKTVGQTLRPYSYYRDVDLRGAFVGRTNYQAVMARVEKRFRGAGVVSANYTWSRSKGNSDTDKGYLESNAGGRIQDFNNLDAEYSLSSFDVPHRFVASFVLEMPFGKGKKFGSDASGFVDALISGWSVNGIYTYRSGYPLNIYSLDTSLNTLFGLGRIRANVVAGCDPDLGSDQSYTKWFNTDCFTAPGKWEVGNAPRNTDVVRMDYVNNVDLSVGKAFKLGGSTKLDFRVEAFNLFNRTQFGTPTMQVGARGYGSVSSQQNKQRLIQLGLRLTF
jgi:outer membrane receptor protein involved in Fe transport